MDVLRTERAHSQLCFELANDLQRFIQDELDVVVDALIVREIVCIFSQTVQLDNPISELITARLANLSDNIVVNTPTRRKGDVQFRLAILATTPEHCVISAADRASAAGSGLVTNR